MHTPCRHSRHRRAGRAAAAPTQLVRQSGDHPRTGGRDRVAQAAAGAERVDLLLVEPELARRPEVDERLGAELAGSAPEIGDGVDAVVTLPVQRRAALAGRTGGARCRTRGRRFVVSTTGTPGTVERQAGLAEPSGVALVDAPLSGNVASVLAGSLTVYLGGDGAAAAEPKIVRTYADPVLPTGPRDSALRVNC